MLHEDHLGNRGDLTAGGVQWMTAGRGIIHSEMPQQTAGRLRGFQLWLNLPAAEKMKPAGYRDIPAADIPNLTLAGEVIVKVIAGRFASGQYSADGPIQHAITQPLYWDIALPHDTQCVVQVPPAHNCLLFVFEGELAVDGARVPPTTTAILTHGDTLTLSSTAPARCLLIGGKPLGEPVVQYGPFVMNTRDEIERAVRDYQSGRLTA